MPENLVSAIASVMIGTGCRGGLFDALKWSAKREIMSTNRSAGKTALEWTGVDWSGPWTGVDWSRSPTRVIRDRGPKCIVDRSGSWTIGSWYTGLDHGLPWTEWKVVSWTVPLWIGIYLSPHNIFVPGEGKP